MLRFLLILLAFAACTSPKPPPTEREIRGYLEGNYCADGVRLVLSDDQYLISSRVKTPMRTGLLYEHCTGSYALTSTDSTWTLTLAADPNPYALGDCQAVVSVWEKGKGYLVGDTAGIREPLSGIVVLKGKCE